MPMTSARLVSRFAEAALAAARPLSIDSSASNRCRIAWIRRSPSEATSGVWTTTGNVCASLIVGSA